MSEDIRIRSFVPGDPVPVITALLHEAYSSLASQGFRYVATHQDDSVTLRRLLSGHPFVAERGKEIIGTITLYPPSPDSLCPWYRLPAVYRFGQFGVRPDLQRQGIGIQLYQQVEALARSRGAAEIALDTAEGAGDLRAWYGRLGFRFIEFVSWEQTNYRSVILSKCLL